MTNQHTAREVAQLALGIDEVVGVDVLDDAALGEWVLELTVANDTVDGQVMSLLAGWGLRLDPDRTATRGDPTHTVVVAR